MKVSIFNTAAALLLAAGELVSAQCAADNCLRAMRATQVAGRIESARAFCGAFAAKPTMAASEYPSFASSCQADSPAALSARIASACKCIAATSTAAVTSTVSATSTTPTATGTSFSTLTPSGTTTAPSTTTSVAGMEACAEVSKLWLSGARKATAFVLGTPQPIPTVPAALAHDCLASVPLGKAAAIELVDAIVPYLEWQSDLAALKNPPKDYFYPPFDPVGHLAKVRANLVADKYKGELEFQEDLYQLTARIHDGHFVFYPDVLTKVFEYVRPFGLVTYSKDTLSLPVIKTYDDVNDLGDEESIPITKINGMDASQYVQDVVNAASGNQDPDAAYNTMFFSRPLANAGSDEGLFRQGGRHKFIYPGPNTTMEYITGEVRSLQNIAVVKLNMTGVTDGASFYKKFVNIQSPASLANDPISATPRMAEIPGYPIPILNSNDSVVSGYYIDEPGYEDVAVLFLSGFDPRNPAVFQKAVDYFISFCKQDGKTKIIIDLQMNGGGYIFQGYDLFRQFFPTIEQDGFNRWRENEQFMALAQIFSKAAGKIDPKTTPSEDEVNIWENWFNYRYDLNVSNQKFESFDAKFAPRMWRGDPYTAILRWDMSDELTTSNETFGLGITITGYGSRKNFTQPFPAENIILLTDGYCASTCSLFSSMMKLQGKVKTVAMGGRPNMNPMQGVGGVKGAQVLSYDQIWNTTGEILKMSSVDVSSDQAASLSKLTTLPTRRSTNARLNVRDQILRPNLEDGMPAQMVYEPADCRLFWTFPMLQNPTHIWKAAADAAWKGSKCVAGTGFGKRDLAAEEEARKRAVVRPRRATTVVGMADVPAEAAKVGEPDLVKYNQRVQIV